MAVIQQKNVITKVCGASVFGINANLISIEVNIIPGTKLFMVGLPDNAIKESQHRIESVIKSIGAFMPRKRVIINLAPADIKKEGASYDLPIALGILQCSKQYSFQNFEDYLILGELSLDGYLRPIKGVLPIAIEAKKHKLKGFILPKENANEAAVVNGLDVIPITHIHDAINFFTGKKTIFPIKCDNKSNFEREDNFYNIDFSDVQGQQTPKRAFEIAAAGGHNIILIGPPGAGKTMLAKRIVTVLPPLTLAESLETTKIYSVSGKLNSNSSLVTKRPFRSPHHTISDVAMVGGGSIPQPGELSLSHNGVLFLDELPEFKRTVLEVMRQPMEDKKVTISRSKMNVEFPTNFMLIASMNPCPCGFYNHPSKECVCGPGVVSRYLNKISGPLMDRIDIQLEITPVSFEEMTEDEENEKSSTVKERVCNARKIQSRRFEDHPHIYSNSMMDSVLCKSVSKISKNAKNTLKMAMEKLKLSARAYDRIMKVSRTIADLDLDNTIQEDHILEAVNYRNLDRQNWWGA